MSYIYEFFQLANNPYFLGEILPLWVIAIAGWIALYHMYK